MEERKSFGKYIREKRVQKGYSQAQLAELLFISESAVSKWERGINYPDITMISDICKVLEINEHELITASDDTEYRLMKTDAFRFRRLSKATLYICTALYSTALIICFICNLAVNHTLSWFWIVLGALVCAFSFVPTFTFMVKEKKFLFFLATSAGSVVLLLLICGIYVRSVKWVPVAAAGILLGYAAVFLPFILKSIKIPRVHKVGFLLYIIILLILTELVILCSSLLADFSVVRGMTTALYFYIPFIIMGVLFIFLKDGLLRAGISVILCGITLFGANAIISLLYPEIPSQNPYAVNLLNWSPNYISGNILFLVLLVIAITGCALILSSIKGKLAKK